MAKTRKAFSAGKFLHPLFVVGSSGICKIVSKPPRQLATTAPCITCLQQVGWSTTPAPPLLNLSALVLVEPVHWWRGLVEGSAKRSQSCPAVIWPLLVFPVRLSALHWQPGNCGTSATMLLLSWSLVNLVQTLHCAGPMCS